MRIHGARAGRFVQRERVGNSGTEKGEYIQPRAPVDECRRAAEVGVSCARARRGATKEQLSRESRTSGAPRAARSARISSTRDRIQEQGILD